MYFLSASATRFWNIVHSFLHLSLTWNRGKQKTHTHIEVVQRIEKEVSVSKYNNDVCLLVIITPCHGDFPFSDSPCHISFMSPEIIQRYISEKNVLVAD